jgi:hypothetical protein
VAVTTFKPNNQGSAHLKPSQDANPDFFLANKQEKLDLLA